MLNTLGSHCKYIKSETKGPTFISPSVTVPLQLSVSLMQRCCCRALNMIAQIMSTFSILSSGEPAWCSRHDYFYTISPYIITPINLTMMWLGNVKRRQDPSGYQTWHNNQSREKQIIITWDYHNQIGEFVPHPWITLCDVSTLQWFCVTSTPEIINCTCSRDRIFLSRHSWGQILRKIK